ncbi:MAG TPA: DUF6644 family protein [Vicinamibacterales bacterium]|nr:DUF6644 family protein [Vicinamibacterales bacterium]
MNVTWMLEWLQRTSVAVQIRDSLYTFPVLESIHVVGLALVFGTIAILDLRLLGVASLERAVSRLMADLLKWTWAAFAVTAVTGGLMFSTNAVVYFHNTFFRAKMILLVLAGVNMLVFELTARKTIARWDASGATPRAAKVVATVSLLIWVGVIVAGRAIGFTATRTSLPTGGQPDVNFEDLLGLPK